MALDSTARNTQPAPPWNTESDTGSQGPLPTLRGYLSPLGTVTMVTEQVPTQGAVHILLLQTRAAQREWLSGLATGLIKLQSTTWSVTQQLWEILIKSLYTLFQQAHVKLSFSVNWRELLFIFQICHSLFMWLGGLLNPALHFCNINRWILISYSYNNLIYLDRKIL